MEARKSDVVTGHDKIMVLTARKYLLSVPAGNISRSIFIFLKKS